MTHRALFLAVAAAHLVAACGTTPEPRTEIRTVEVQVPVARSCVPDTMPQSPAYRVTRATLLAAVDPAARLTMAVAGMLERDARLAETEPVIEACRD